MNTIYLDSIRAFEGFTAQAQWDYAQHSNGYGTRALYPGEIIGPAEAERRFQTEIAKARAVVERLAGHLDDGTKAALTSLTYNAGDTWTRSGLGDAVRSGDLDTARELFLQYNKAGGKTLSGLVERRIAEASWIGENQSEMSAVEPAHRVVASVLPAAGDAAAAASHTAEPASIAGLPPLRADAAYAGVTKRGVAALAGARDIGASPLATALRLQMALALVDRADPREDEGRTTGARGLETSATS